VRIPPVRQAIRRGDHAAAARSAPLPVLYEDERLLVIDKPAGLAVHGGSGLSHGVIEALRAARPDAPCLELVHRLDRETSGCLLIAKRRSELRTLHRLLREGGVSKRYLLLARGRMQERSRRVRMALRKNQRAGGERLVRISGDGKASETRFHLVETFSGACLLEAEPVTGRTHQIRVHAAGIGHPLAGDRKYGDPAFNARMRGLGLRRLFLHAHSIAFSDPATGREIHVTAPLADELREVLDRLENPPGGRG
jgi:23S rRNA pseudouridine955/2504/2580 synthase